MKVIFLDVDGVLNWAGTVDRIGRTIGLCSERIARFNKILEAHPDAKIVISSDWRYPDPPTYHDFQGLVKLLQERGLKGEIVGHTPMYVNKRPRGLEISTYLEAHPEVTNFVVLDDDADGMEGAAEMDYDGETGKWVRIGDPMGDLRPRFVQTYHYGRRISGGYTEPEIYAEGGLQDEHIRQAIQILNGQLLEVK